MSRLVGPRQVLSFIGPWQTLSFIGPELTISGDVHCEGDVEIAGTVNGNVKARQIRVSRRGRLNGAAESGIAVIEGALEGSLTADSVTLGNKAYVRADINYRSLKMAAGAVFMGFSQSSGKKESAAEPDGLRGCGSAGRDVQARLVFHERVGTR
jgi:cytoskeletal protein CcmA (bactofilin family)